MKKKLIFVSEALWIGGIETALVNLLNRLDYDKYDVTCLILRDCLDMADRITPQCHLIVADRQKPVSFSEPYSHKRMFNLMEEPQGATAFRRWIWKVLCLVLKAPEARRYAAYVRQQLGEECFDTAIIYSDRAAETAVRAVSAEKFLMFYHHGGMRKEYHDELGYKRSSHVIAVSEPQAEKLRAFRPEYAQKIIAVNNLIDVDGVRQKSRAPIDGDFSADRVHLVTCGRLAVEKGVDLAEEACERLLARGVTGFHWWIVGGGPEEQKLRRSAEEKGLTPYMTFLGMQANPYPWIAQADLYVQPSRIEGHPLTVLEAQVLGRPVLATETAGSSAILSGSGAGMLCAISAEAIADGVQKLLEQPQLRKRMAAKAAEIDFEAQNDAVLERLYHEFD